jgi:hypothetical protein
VGQLSSDSICTPKEILTPRQLLKTGVAVEKLTHRKIAEKTLR